MSLSLSRNALRIDHRAVKARHHSAWASGDYAVVGDELCETLRLYRDARVLHVASINGHKSLAAACQRCEVDEAEALPFPDQTFDAVISIFGAMFAPDQERAASEIIRVCRRGGLVGLANWTPDGFMGQLFELVNRYAPAIAHPASPFLWGTEERLHDLFGVYGRIEAQHKRVAFRCHTPAQWVEAFKTSVKLDADVQCVLTEELLGLIARFNRADDDTLLLDAAYLEVSVQRS